MATKITVKMASMETTINSMYIKEIQLCYDNEQLNNS